MYQNAIWPGWKTIRQIGRGSFGAVYEIQRDVLGETEKAALKIISIPQDDGDIDEMYSDGYDSASITSTFESHLKSIVAEYTLMRKMNGHSNIVNCDDVRYVQHDDGIGWDIYIKMELLTPLTKSLPSNIPDDLVVHMAIDICSALNLCKKHGIIHRDIKPQNIFVSDSGNYKLGDFGIAKTAEKTTGGTKIGTYKYMAPEVYNNKPYGSSVDIYSLGLVMYWMLNERRMPFLPLPPISPTADMDEHARQRRFSGGTLPLPKNGSDTLKAIVMKACAFDPKDRYQSAQEMIKALKKLNDDISVPSDERNLDISFEDRTVGLAWRTNTIPSNAQTADTQMQNDYTKRNATQLMRESAGNSATNINRYSAQNTPPRNLNRWKLLSILTCVLCLLLATVLIFTIFLPDKASAPPETTTPTEPYTMVNVNVSDAFSDSFIESEFDTNCCYHIPQINTNYFTCGDFNREMYDELYGILQEQVYTPKEQGECINLKHMNYNWGQKNNLVSFLVTTQALAYDWADYYTYHVFADTGVTATDQDILDMFQLTEDGFHDLVAQRIQECYDNEENLREFTSQAELDQLISDSLEPSNVQNARPYIGSDGELYAITGIYWPAGAGYYYRLLGITCQKEDTFPSCADHEKAYLPPETVPNPIEEKKHELGQAQIGDVIVFGNYEQDNNFSNGPEPIQWLVIGKTYNRLFVISQYALDHQSFHTERIPITWEDCYLRQWLNDSFYNAAFSAEEQTLIPTVTVTADWNPKYQNHPGNDTEDKIYILSTSEAERFFSSDKARICYATKFAKSHSKVWIDSDSGSIWWWLRTPGEYPSDATTVNTNGKIDYKDGMVDSVTGTVRPVFWIEFG